MVTISLNTGTYHTAHVHIATKLRTRLLKPSVILPMGKYVASPTYLILLMSETNKNDHALTASDFDYTDKMNFRSMKKMYDLRVTNLLLNKVPESKAIVLYLQFARCIVNSFINKLLSPIKKIKNIWRYVFFLRQWINWLHENKYSISKNFITQNTYKCVELNAHNLILIIQYFRDNDISDLFTSWLMSSQPCESFFRAARSMTSTQSTVVNFNMLEFIYRVRRIDLQNIVMQNLNKSYVFPRNKRASAISGDASETLFSLPTDLEIINTVKFAREEALCICSHLGMEVADEKTIMLFIMPIFNKNNKKTLDNDEEDEEDEDDNAQVETAEELNVEETDLAVASPNELMIKNTS